MQYYEKIFLYEPIGPARISLRRFRAAIKRASWIDNVRVSFWDKGSEVAGSQALVLRFTVLANSQRDLPSFAPGTPEDECTNRFRIRLIEVSALAWALTRGPYMFLRHSSERHVCLMIITGRDVQSYNQDHD